MVEDSGGWYCGVSKSFNELGIRVSTMISGMSSQLSILSCFYAIRNLKREIKQTTPQIFPSSTYSTYFHIVFIQTFINFPFLAQGLVKPSEEQCQIDTLKADVPWTIWCTEWRCFWFHEGSLVGGWGKTPLKNDGVRQLGWWDSQYEWENAKLMATKPPTRFRMVNGAEESAATLIIVGYSCFKTDRV